MDNFEKVMKQNVWTASSLLDLAKDDGKVKPDVIMDTISSLDMKGMKMQYENTHQRESEKVPLVDSKIKEEKVQKGLSAYIEKVSQKEKMSEEKAEEEKTTEKGGVIKIDFSAVPKKTKEEKTTKKGGIVKVDFSKTLKGTEKENKGLKKIFAENGLKPSRKRVEYGVVKLTPKQKRDIMDRMVQKRKDYAKSA